MSRHSPVVTQLIRTRTVKVLYTLDSSPQSYVTILSDKQDVFFHASSTSHGTQAEPDSLGTAYLKPIVRGICSAR